MGQQCAPAVLLLRRRRAAEVGLEQVPQTSKESLAGVEDSGTHLFPGRRRAIVDPRRPYGHVFVEKGPADILAELVGETKALFQPLGLVAGPRRRFEAEESLADVERA